MNTTVISSASVATFCVLGLALAETAPEPPAVDFSQETVLVATMGRRSTGGYAIEFVRIHQEGDTLVATLDTTAPGPEDLVTMALTAPYSIIAIPKHEGPIRFVQKGEDGDRS